MNSSFRYSLFAVSLLGPLALALPAAAQDIAAAEALFNDGLAHMEAGRYETGCKAIAESQRLDPRAGTLFTLATCEARWGHVATAVTRFGDYLTLYERLTPEQQARQGNRPISAKEQRAKLGPEVPELTLSLLPGAPVGTVVERNGAVIAGAALGLPLPVDPGEYLVSTRVPGGDVWEQRITIAKGEKKQVTLQVTTAPAVDASKGKVVPVKGKVIESGPPAVKTGPSGRRVAAYVVGGVGLAGLALGGVMGGLTLAKKGTIDEHCGKGINSSDETLCDQTGLDAANGAKTFGLVSTLGLAVGLAGVATSAVLLLTEPRKTTTANAAHGRWISAGVLSVGPSGGMVGAQGAW